MSRLRNLKVEDEKIEILSDAISRFINSVNKFGDLEGVFVLSLGVDHVSSMLVELVYNSDNLDRKIMDYDQSFIRDVSMLTDINIKIETIPYKYYTDSEHDSYYFPYNGMLKSGHIIYDPNGSLGELQGKYRKNPYIDNLGWRGAVKSRPPIQYKKEM